MADHEKLLLASAAFVVLSLLKTKKRKKGFGKQLYVKTGIFIMIVVYCVI
nr:unnamed protein product [Callosobruchus analis]